MWYSAIGCLVTLMLSLLGVPLAAAAQPPGKVPRIGLLIPGSASGFSSNIEAFRQGLRDLGWVEGQHITLEERYAENLDRLPDLAADLVRLRVDLIVAGTTAAARAAKHATRTIPIVVAVSADPVGDGLVASLAQPGGNLTGLSIMTPELTVKRLELLKEAVPTASRVAVLFDPANLSGVRQWREMEGAAGALGVQLQPLEVRGPEEFAEAFQMAMQGQAQALIIQVGALFGAHRARLAELALASRLPTMAGVVGYAKAGGLMDYGANQSASWYRAATYVHKILKGAKPGDLPVEQPMKFTLIINLKTAKTLGLTIPPMLLFQADEVIQ
jgi:putative tryptophan/tyrosine transport system substrate-binding protein